MSCPNCYCAECSAERLKWNQPKCIPPVQPFITCPVQPFITCDSLPAPGNSGYWQVYTAVEDIQEKAP